MHICPTNYSGFRRTEYPGGEDISTGEAESDDRWNSGSSACLDVHTPPLPLPAVPFRVAKRLPLPGYDGPIETPSPGTAKNTLAAHNIEIYIPNH
jgi:hypothetical protein